MLLQEYHFISIIDVCVFVAFQDMPYNIITNRPHDSNFLMCNRAYFARILRYTVIIRKTIFQLGTGHIRYLYGRLSPLLSDILHAVSSL